jgi:SAM-dependent methyltransferase
MEPLDRSSRGKPPESFEMTGARYLGVGPGPKTRDGCSVELYLRLPYRGEVALIERYIPEAGSVLELGCGVGRVTRELLAHGYRVTAVDNSPEMLAHVPAGATTICANIESLAIDEKFDAVILASCLINTPDTALRQAQLTRCRELMKPAGRLLIERFDPAWLANVQAGPLDGIGNVSMSVDEARGSGSIRELCLRYRDGEDEWLQYFAAAILEDEDIRRCLSSAGFEAPDWINRRWASVRYATAIRA